MINKFITYLLTKFFMKHIVSLLNTENLVKYKLDTETYKRLEAKVGTIRGNNISQHEYAYMLGQQSVLKALRDDYVR